MEDVLKAKAKSICITEQWSLSSPKEAAGMKLEDFLAPEVVGIEPMQLSSADHDVGSHTNIRVFVLETS